MSQISAILRFGLGWSLIIAAATSTATAEAGDRLRVMTYNIHHAEGEDRKLDVERIANVILEARPDLVSVQEVDRKVRRTRDVDQPAELARLTKMHFAFGANISLQGGEYGNVILSRFPLMRHENHHLPCHKMGEQRGVLEAEIAWPNDEARLIFLATHFDHRPDDGERKESADYVSNLADQLAKAQPERRFLLAGDLNDHPTSEPLARLQKAGWRTNPGELPTIPVAAPKRQIDFVLVRPADRWRIISTTVLPEAIASDHRAVLMELEAP